jgi:hypothetical protein
MFGFSAPRAESLSEFRFGDAEVQIQSVSNVYFSQKERVTPSMWRELEFSEGTGWLPLRRSIATRPILE